MLPSLSLARLRALLDEHAPARALPRLPDLVAWWAEDELPLWSALEAELGHPVGAPFFVVPWPGAQALALAVERGLVEVSGRRVLDVGAGDGLAAIACARRGARAIAADVDWLACASSRLLAERNGVALDAVCVDALEVVALGARCDVVLAGDVVYSRAHASALERAVAAWLEAGVDVVLADSGRPFFTPCGLPCVFEEEVAVARGVDGVSRRRVRVYARRGRNVDERVV